MKKKELISIISIVSLLLAITSTIGVMVYYNVKIKNISATKTEVYTDYAYHYAFITENYDDPLWESIYAGAKKQGKEYNAYVENFAANVTLAYSMNEMLEMAIVAKVDGIIVEGDDSIETSSLINTAVEQGIHVVTVLNDCVLSTRCSFIGINNYKLGKEYANQIINYSKDAPTKVVVLLNASNATNEEIMWSGLENTISENYSKIELHKLDVKSEIMFTSEEIIRNLIKNKKEQPDIIVCLSLTDTISAYQSVVDFNKVGKIEILGSYQSQPVLEAIDKNIIAASMAIDTDQMGRSAVDSLFEFQTYGRVSDYVSVDFSLIHKDNVKQFMKHTDEENKP
ncbi:MAG TPA: substrate-binding domain-containing protein [Candidatus Merdenecus merdavium]|nr:substrate-binding domain-containing protein [Candidatus Merdenecus merdavium]